MNKHEAKRRAHANVAALIVANLGTQDGDLFVDFQGDEGDDDDLARYCMALDELAREHFRKATRVRRQSRGREPGWWASDADAHRLFHGSEEV